MVQSRSITMRKEIAEVFFIFYIPTYTCIMAVPLGTFAIQQRFTPKERCMTVRFSFNVSERAGRAEKKGSSDAYNSSPGAGMIMRIL